LKRFRRRAPRSRRRFFCPHAKKESPAALVMLQGFYQDDETTKILQYILKATM
jgi:hypothetical protein